MSEYHPRPPFDPESFDYGLDVVTIAGNSLRTNINTLAASDNSAIAVDIKTDPLGANSPVTQHDRETEQLIGNLYWRHLFVRGKSNSLKGTSRTNHVVWPHNGAPYSPLPPLPWPA